jgi:hypothetical protein
MDIFVAVEDVVYDDCRAHQDYDQQSPSLVLSSREGKCWNGISHHQDIILKRLNTIPLYLNRTPLYLIVFMMMRDALFQQIIVTLSLFMQLSLLQDSLYPYVPKRYRYPRYRYLYVFIAHRLASSFISHKY